MAYGGGLVEWFANPGGRVDFSVRSLFGFGRATLASTVETPSSTHCTGTRAVCPLRWTAGHGRHWGRWSPRGHRAWSDDFEWPSSFTFRYREDFLIADPQLSVHLNVTDWLRIGGGAGYRFVGRAGSDGDRLRGFTASIGLQLGPAVGAPDPVRYYPVRAAVPPLPPGAFRSEPQPFRCRFGARRPIVGSRRSGSERGLLRRTVEYDVCAVFRASSRKRWRHARRRGRILARQAGSRWMAGASAGALRATWEELTADRMKPDCSRS